MRWLWNKPYWQALTRQIVRDDESSAREFTARLTAQLPRLRRYAASLCRNPADREDLVQNTCLKALAGRKSWDPSSNFNAWSCRIMRNQWIDTFRQRQTRGQEQPADETEDLAGHEASSELQLYVQQVKRAISQLPEEMCEVLSLVCIEELSYKDAAEVLGIPIGTVMSRLARARIKLAELTGQLSMELI
jgi:RNA polymerase sigma-70 factor, ECF subfamily